VRMEDSGTDPTLVYKEGRRGGLAIWGLLMEDVPGPERHPAKVTGTAERLRRRAGRRRRQGLTGARQRPRNLFWKNQRIPTRPPLRLIAFSPGVADGAASPSKRRPAVPVAFAGCRLGPGSVFHEKAPNCKAATAAFLIDQSWVSPRVFHPHSQGAAIGLGALWGSTAVALHSLRRPRRLKTLQRSRQQRGLRLQLRFRERFLLRLFVFVPTWFL
jgi:hypothetical protein